MLTNMLNYNVLRDHFVLFLVLPHLLFFYLRFVLFCFHLFALVLTALACCLHIVDLIVTYFSIHIVHQRVGTLFFPYSFRVVGRCALFVENLFECHDMR